MEDIFENRRTPHEQLAAMLNGKIDCMGCKGSGRWTVEQRMLHTKKPMPKVTKEIGGTSLLVDINPKTPCSCSMCNGTGKALLTGKHRQRALKALTDAGIEIIFVDKLSDKP